jgi:hypothetical protein
VDISSYDICNAANLFGIGNISICNAVASSGNITIASDSNIFIQTPYPTGGTAFISLMATGLTLQAMTLDASLSANSGTLSLSGDTVNITSYGQPTYILSTTNTVAMISLISNVGLVFNDFNGWNNAGNGGILLSNMYQDPGAGGYLSVNSSGQLLWNGNIIA